MGRNLHPDREVLEAGVIKRSSGNYSVTVTGVWGGTFKSRIEANQIAREMRRELHGEFALAPVTWRRIIRGRPAP